MIHFLWLLLLAPDGAVTPDGAVAPPPPADPPQAVMHCAPNPVRMGEHLTCALKITHGHDVSVNVQAPAGATLEAPTPAVPKGDELVTRREFDLLTTSMRDVKVKGVSVHWQQVGGAEGAVPIPDQRVPVKSVLGNAKAPTFKTFETPGGDAETFWTRHGPVAWLVTNWPLIITALALLGLAVGSLIGFLIWRWVASREREEIPWIDPRPAHVIAFEKLDQLVAEALPQAGEVKPYYTRLSEIVRDYIQRRFDIQALEMTSDEIREAARDLDLAAEARLGMDDFLNEAELVKFADFSPSESAIDTIMRLARGLVELTREREEKIAEEGE